MKSPFTTNSHWDQFLTTTHLYINHKNVEFVRQWNHRSTWKLHSYEASLTSCQKTWGMLQNWRLTFSLHAATVTVFAFVTRTDNNQPASRYSLWSLPALFAIQSEMFLITTSINGTVRTRFITGRINTPHSPTPSIAFCFVIINWK